MVLVREISKLPFKIKKKIFIKHNKNKQTKSFQKHPKSNNVFIHSSTKHPSLKCVFLFIYLFIYLFLFFNFNFNFLFLFFFFFFFFLFHCYHLPLYLPVGRSARKIQNQLWGFTCIKRVTLVYLYYVNRCGHHKKLSIAKLDFVQVCGLSLNFYNNTLRKFYKFSDSQETWTSPTLQSADWPISRQYYWPQVRQRVSYPEV